MRFRSICLALALTLVLACSDDGKKPTNPGDQTAPSSVTDLAAQTATENSITVAWTAPGDDGNSGTASQYDLRYSLTIITGDNWDVALRAEGEPNPAEAGTRQTYTLSGLQAATTYYFALKTADEVPNWSGLSNIMHLATAKPPDVTAPSAMADLAAGSATSSSLNLTWTAPGDDGDTGAADQYEIRYATFALADSTWSLAAAAANPPEPEEAGTVQSYLLTGLEPSTTYFVAAKAADEAGNWSEISNIASASTVEPPDVTPPAVISDLSVSAQTPGSITLSWTAPGDDGNTGTAHQYDIRASISPLSGANFADAVQVPMAPQPAPAGTRQSMVVTNLSAGATYYFGMRTSDEVPQWSAVSNIAVGSTTISADITAPAAVQDLYAGSATPDGLTITWTAPGDDGTTGTAYLYELRYSTETITEANFYLAGQVAGMPPPSAAGTPESRTVSGLSSSTTYHFALTTADEAANWSPISNIAQATTTALIDTVAPGDVTDLDVEVKGTDFLALAWTAPGDDAAAGTASYYDIRYSTSPITAETWSSASQAVGEEPPKPAGTLEGFTVGGLQAGTTYYLALRTGDEAGNWSGISNVTSDTTLPPPDSQAPAAVPDLTVVGQTPTSLTLSWTAPGDDGSTGTAAAYDVRYLTYAITAANWVWAVQAQNEPAPMESGQVQTFEVTGLQPQTTYYIALKTADEMNNLSGLSNVAVGTTQPAVGDVVPPSRITDLSAGSPTMNTIVLSWTATGDDYQEGTASQYDIRFSTTAFSEVTWDNATPLIGEPTPTVSGSTQNYAVAGLSPGVIYYFGMKAADEIPNWSPLSNTVSMTTMSLPDIIPPAAVTDLRVSEISADYVTLAWGATGDDGTSGTAKHYDIRYSGSPITEAGWSSANQAQGEPNPNPPGFPEQFTISDLTPGSTYYFALKAADEVPNWSGLSNVPMAVTMLPALTGYVHHDEGGPLASALVELKNCGGSDTGLTTYTESDGYFQFVTVDPGDYFLKIIKAGCTDQVDPPDSTCFTITGQATLHRNIITMHCDYTAWASVTITWGENPRDLDLHCWTPSIEGQAYHIYYASQGYISQPPFAELDHDDVTSWGPENLTVYENHPGQYVFAVYHFSGSGTISSSGGVARIVGPGGDMDQISVPMGATNSHWWWWLCSVNGTTGEVTLINEVHPDPPVQNGVPMRLPVGFYNERK